VPTQPDTWPERAHEHTSSCYWDLRICRWVCAPQPAAGNDAVGTAGEVPVAAGTAAVIAR
jgi:hypothetical protein